MLSAILFTCAATIMTNKTTEPWTEDDLATRDRYIVRCKEEYNDCLKELVKKEPGNYWAICGGKKEIK